jgi:hypothetical protein
MYLHDRSGHASTSPVGEVEAKRPGEGFHPIHQVFTPHPNPLPMGEGARLTNKFTRFCPGVTPYP